MLQLMSSKPSEDPKSATIQLRVSPTFLKIVDAWRRQQEDPPTRSEAVRLLAMIGAGAKPKPK
jgi:hypothetical protein